MAKVRTPLLLMLAAAGVPGCAPGQPAQLGQPASQSVYLEDFTWTEVRNLVRSGSRTIIIPVGGVEQSGPNIALGKHDFRVRLLSGLIARNLGNTLVAPTLSYVPEGAPSPPEGHMRFPGTITVPASAFRELLSSAAMSLRLAGFTDIILIGDHGGYQQELKQVADDLNRKWANTPVRALYAAAYYDATQTSYVAELRRRGYSAGEIGTHAGLADTSLSLAVSPAMVRVERLSEAGAASPVNGVRGDPRRSSRELGTVGVGIIVRTTVAAIRSAEAGR
jgi:creatinine amidohydrolase